MAENALAAIMCDDRKEPTNDTRPVAKAMRQRGFLTADEAAAEEEQGTRRHVDRSSHMAGNNPENGVNSQADNGPVVQTDGQRAHRHQAKGKEVHASTSELRDLLDSQGYLCAACFIPLTPQTAEIDHIVARADGGTNAPLNLQWLCKNCNRAKGDMSMVAFIEMVERIAHRRKSMAQFVSK